MRAGLTNLWKTLAGVAVLLAAGAASAQAPPLPLLDAPPATVCNSPTVPTEPGSIHMFPGRWWNPNRNGIGWDFFYGDGQTSLYLTWFTYDKAGRPVWLHGQARDVVLNAITGERTWQSNLYWVTWNRAGMRRSTPVGAVSVTFPRQTTTRAAVRWKWYLGADAVGSGTYDECLYDTYRDFGPQGRDAPTLNQAFSSNWFYAAETEHPLVGWGVDLLVDLLPVGHNYLETATAAIFDDADRPVWVQSVDDWGSSAPPGNTFQMTGTGKLRYLRHAAVAAGEHPATKDCASSSCVYVAHANDQVNRFLRSMESGRRGAMSVRALVPVGPARANPDDPNSPGTPIDWPPVNNQATPFPYPPTPIPVYRYDGNHVIVDRSVCRVPDQNTTCAFTVSWVSDDAAAVVRKLDLNNDARPIAGFNRFGPQGEVVDPLRLGDRVQYEISYTSMGRTTYHRTPEVRVLKEGDVADEIVDPVDCEEVEKGCDLGVHDSTVGASAGEAGVDGGSAVYAMPIDVPPGRNRMQPEVALKYGSRGGNESAGVGWSLSAGGSIHRCPRTTDQDGAGNAAAVTLGAGDALCLDGQRLMLVGADGRPTADQKTGYGQQGSVYRTEIDSFSRIVQAGGTLADATACFKVEEKSGRISHYGATVYGAGATAGCSGAARVVPVGATGALSWLLAKVEDRVGNNMLYRYRDFGSAELLLEEIRYTGFGAESGNRSVVFTYEPRPTAGGHDIASTWLAGGLTRSTRRLAEISTCVPLQGASSARCMSGSERMRSWTLRYDTPSASTGRSLLRSVQECAYKEFSTTPECRAPTTFDWQEAAPDYAFKRMTLELPAPAPLPDPVAFDAQARAPMPAEAPNPVSGSPLDIYRMDAVGDVDGDGARESVVTSRRADGGYDAYLVSIGADRAVVGAPRQIDPAVWGTVSGFLGAPGDADNDGRAEMLGAPPYTTNAAAAGDVVLTSIIPGTGPISSANFSHVHTGVVARTGTDGVDAPTGREELADMNGDGKADLVVVRGGMRSRDTWFDATQCPAAVLVHLNTTANAAAAPVTFSAAPAFVACLSQRPGATENLAGLEDLDGDGVRDLLISGGRYQDAPLDGVWFGQRTASGGYAATHTLLSALGADFRRWEAPSWAVEQQWVDVNGDGLRDYYDDTCHGRTLRINTGRRGPGLFGPRIALEAQKIDASRECLRPSDIAYSAPGRPHFTTVFDVDGDGREEVLSPGGFAMRVCVVGRVNVGTGGEPETYAYCPLHPVLPTCTAPGQSGCEPRLVDETFIYPVRSMYGGSVDYSAHDRSLYRMDALRFVPAASGGYLIERAGTAITMVPPTLNNLPHAEDVYGDGLADVVTGYGCPYTQCLYLTTFNGYPYGPSTLPDGSALTYRGVTLSENRGAGSRGTLPPRAPDFLREATNGMGDFAQWEYFPLSSRAGRGAGAPPLYRVPARDTGTGYVDARHHYFASSMNVVESLVRSNGVGGVDGARSMRFGYTEAMFNHQGRGFQGFRSILSENMPSAADAARKVRKVELFHQKFPLTGRLESVDSGLPTGPTGVQPWLREEYAWGCNVDQRDAACDTANGTQPRDHPYVRKHLATTFEPTQPGVRIALTEVRNYDQANTQDAKAGFDRYGNVTFQEVEKSDLWQDGDGYGKFVTQSRTRSQHSYVEGRADWWIDRLRDTTVTSFAVDYASGGKHPLPLGTQDGTRVLVTRHTWNDDRTLQKLEVQPDLAEPARTSQYSYTAFRYPTPSQGVAEYVDVYGVATEGSASPSVRTTRSELDLDDGYFAWRTTNAAGHQSYVHHRARDGQVTSTVDATGLLTENHYDAFGHLVATTYQGQNGALAAQPTKYAWSSCVQAGCAVVGNGGRNADGTAADALAAYRITKVQNGSPTEVGWFDVLGRQIKSASRGFDGRFVARLMEYDAMGTVRRQSAPFFLGADQAGAEDAGTARFNTTMSYDALGRLTRRVSPGAELDPVNGDVVAAYAYVGNRTDVVVGASRWMQSSRGGAASCSAPDNLCTNSRRYSGVLGAMRTVDVAGGVTRYWYDASGRPIALADANANGSVADNVALPEGAATVMTYDELGHRVALRDPNQGQWSFVFNPFGELRRQVDARGFQTNVVMRDALGRVRVQTSAAMGNVHGAQPGDGQRWETYRDEWDYDVARPGLLHEVRRCMGGQTPLLACTHGGVVSDLRWSERFTYDDLARVEAIDTRRFLSTDHQEWRTSFLYDANFGREKAIKYPSGLVVQTRYKKFGAVQDLLDADTGARFWGVGAKDEWGNVTVQAYGNGMLGEYAYSPSTGQSLSRRWRSAMSPDSPVVDSIAYAYDSFGNVRRQARNTPGQTNGDAYETYTYDKLQRLVRAQPSTANAVDYDYDALGNLRYKSDFSIVSPTAYDYAAPNAANSFCGPSVARQVQVAASGGAVSVGFKCDRNGNVIENGGAPGYPLRKAVYDPTNRPRQITDQTVTSFEYSPDGRRVIEALSETVPETNVPRVRVLTRGSRGFEWEATQGDLDSGTYRHELGDVTVLMKERDGVGAGQGQARTYDVYFRAADRLGSPLGMMNRSGAFLQKNDAGQDVQTRRSFDAFGKARQRDFTARPAVPAPGQLGLAPSTRQGFSGHEHLDKLALIHMNGRAYDFQLGRFLSVDPLVQSPGNSQSLNPYSYLLNNPQAGTDPSGYASCPITAPVKCLDPGRNELTDENGVNLGTIERRGDTFEYRPSSAAWSVGVLRAGFAGNGADQQTPFGPDSDAQNGVREDASGIGGTAKAIAYSASGALLPNVTAALQPHKSGTFGSFVSGYVGGLWNAGADGVDLLTLAIAMPYELAMPGVSKWAPHWEISEEERYGAGVAEATLFLPVFRAGKAAETVTVYRVESAFNQRLVIDAAGNVEVTGSGTLFLNFGDLARAEAFLAQRIARYGEGQAIKAFEVPQSFLDHIRSIAVRERGSRGGSLPLKVDPGRGPNGEKVWRDQFGLREGQFQALRDAIIEGSGRHVK